MSSHAPALEIQALRGGWGPATVVEGVDLALGAGELVAIIGRNGVGKSTLLEVIVGRARCHAGAIRLGGVDVVGQTIHHRSRLGLGYVPQEREVFKSLSVRENLVVAQRPGVWTESTVFELFPSLGHRQRHLAGQLSGGEQLVAAMAAIARNGSMAFLLVEQRIDVALELSSRCLVMDRGRFVHDGDSATLRRHPERIGDLLGLQHAA